MMDGVTILIYFIVAAFDHCQLSLLPLLFSKAPKVALRFEARGEPIYHTIERNATLQ